MATVTRRTDTPDPVPTGGLQPASTVSPTPRYRILKVAPTSFFADYGCHVRIFEETRILQKLGNRVTICTYHTGRDLDGLDIRRALNTPWRETVQVGSSLHKLYYDVLLSAKVAEVALRERPNLVHAHLHEGALIGWPVAKALRAPLIFDFQGSLTSEMIDHHFLGLSRESFLYGPLRRLERMIDDLPAVIITSSFNAADILRDEFNFPGDRVFTIPDSVDADFFRPRADALTEAEAAALRAGLGIPEGRKVIVYLGLLAHYQGTLKLLEAAEILVRRGLPVHFLIMGYPGEEAYRAQAAQMGLAGHVTFTGRVRYEDAPKLLALGDAAVSPKMSETEGNGKLLNYMAVGLPTVCFNTPVAREILGDLGLYAQTGDAADLADRVAESVTESAAAAHLGQKLRARVVEQFSWDVTGRDLLNIYAMVSR